MLLQTCSQLFPSSRFPLGSHAIGWAEFIDCVTLTTLWLTTLNVGHPNIYHPYNMGYISVSFPICLFFYSTFHAINLLHKASKKLLYSQQIWSWFWLLLFLRGIILSTFAIAQGNFSKVFSDKIFKLFLKSLWECVLIHCELCHCYHFLFLRWAIFSVTSPILSFAAFTWNNK